jgi:uncharacterized protein YaiI (UPF0178 family)
VDGIRRATAAGRLAAPVVVVLEGEARRGVAEGVAGGVAVVHAAGSGDDAIVGVAGPGDEPVVVVTADRELARRARDLGAGVVGPGWLLERLDAPPTSD